MANASDIIFYLNEMKEENIMNCDWFPSPPSNGFEISSIVTIEGNNFRIKNIKETEDGKTAVILEEVE